MVKIFVADDQMLLRKLVKESLAEIPGFHVVGEAASGEEALDLIPRACPDVLVTDLSMNGLNGIQVTERVRKLFPSIAIIIWSVSTEYGYVLGALEAGASAYVVKDAGIDALVTAIREVNHDGFFLSPPLSKQKLDEFRTTVRGCNGHRKQVA